MYKFKRLLESPSDSGKVWRPNMYISYTAEVSADDNTDPVMLNFLRVNNKEQLPNFLEVPATSIKGEPIHIVEIPVKNDFSEGIYLRNLPEVTGIKPSKKDENVGWTRCKVYEEECKELCLTPMDTKEIVFSNCPNLRAFADYSFCNRRVTTEIDFSKVPQLMYIGDSAFYNYTSRTGTIDFSGCPLITTIEDYAFANIVPAGEELTLDISTCKNIRRIGAKAFGDAKIGKLILPPEKIWHPGFFQAICTIFKQPDYTTQITVIRGNKVDTLKYTDSFRSDLYWRFF